MEPFSVPKGEGHRWASCSAEDMLPAKACGPPTCKPAPPVKLPDRLRASCSEDLVTGRPKSQRSCKCEGVSNSRAPLLPADAVAQSDGLAQPGHAHVSCVCEASGAEALACLQPLMAGVSSMREKAHVAHVML